MFVLGRDSSVQYSNKAYRILMGLPESESSLRDHDTESWKVNVHPDDLEEATKEWARACAGTSKGSFEWRNLRYPLTGDENKDVIYLRSSTFAELDQDGKMKTLTGLLMDRSIEVAHERITNARMEAALEEKRAQEYFMGEYCSLCPPFPRAPAFGFDRLTLQHCRTCSHSESPVLT